MLQIKDKRINVIFNVIAFSGMAMMVLNIINAITLCFIKDSTKYGIRVKYFKSFKNIYTFYVFYINNINIFFILYF